MCAGVCPDRRVLESITTGPHRVSAQESAVMDKQQAEYSRLMCTLSGRFFFAQATRTTLLFLERPGVSDHSLFHQSYQCIYKNFSLCTSFFEI